jgi:hypothetical protein
VFPKAFSVVAGVSSLFPRTLWVHWLWFGLSGNRINLPRPDLIAQAVFRINFSSKSGSYFKDGPDILFLGGIEYFYPNDFIVFCCIQIDPFGNFNHPIPEGHDRAGMGQNQGKKGEAIGAGFPAGPNRKGRSPEVMVDRMGQEGRGRKDNNPVERRSISAFFPPSLVRIHFPFRRLS